MTDIAGGVDPTPPQGILYRTITQDGALLGAVYVVEQPQEGRINAGAVTHLGRMHTRLAWLGSAAVQGMDLDMDPEAVLAEVCRNSGVRWQASTVTAVEADLDALGHLLEDMAVERGEVERMPLEVPAEVLPSKADLADMAAAAQEAAGTATVTAGPSVPDAPVEASTEDDTPASAPADTTPTPEKPKRPSGGARKAAAAAATQEDTNP